MVVKKPRLASMSVEQLLTKQKALILELNAIGEILKKAADGYREITGVTQASNYGPSAYPIPSLRPPIDIPGLANPSAPTLYYSSSTALDPMDSTQEESAEDIRARISSLDEDSLVV